MIKHMAFAQQTQFSSCLTSTRRKHRHSGFRKEIKIWAVVPTQTDQFGFSFFKYSLFYFISLCVSVCGWCVLVYLVLHPFPFSGLDGALWVSQGNSWGGSLFSPVVYRCFDFSGSWQAPGQGHVCCRACGDSLLDRWLSMVWLAFWSILSSRGHWVFGLSVPRLAFCLDWSSSLSNWWHVRYMVADLHTHYITHRHALLLTLTHTTSAQATVGTSFVSSITAMKDDQFLLLFSVCNVLLRLLVCFFPWHSGPTFFFWNRFSIFVLIQDEFNRILTKQNLPQQRHSEANAAAASLLDWAG